MPKTFDAYLATVFLWAMVLFFTILHNVSPNLPFPGPVLCQYTKAQNRALQLADCLLMPCDLLTLLFFPGRLAVPNANVFCYLFAMPVQERADQRHLDPAVLQVWRKQKADIVA